MAAQVKLNTTIELQVTLTKSNRNKQQINQPRLNTFDSSASSTVSPKQIYLSTKLSHAPYNTTKPKCNCKCQCNYNCFQELCCWIFWILFLSSIMIGLVVGGTLFILWSQQETKYNNSFTIEGYCDVIKRNRVYRETYVSYDHKWNIDSGKIYGICYDKGKKGITTKTFDDAKPLEIGQVKKCYTNTNCDYIWIEGQDRLSSYDDKLENPNKIMIGSYICFGMIPCCWLLWAFFIYLCKLGKYCSDIFMNDKCYHKFCFCEYWPFWCEYWYFVSGKGQEIYHYKQWKDNMKKKDHLDYFVNYYCRKYEIHFANDLYKLLHEYYCKD